MSKRNAQVKTIVDLKEWKNRRLVIIHPFSSFIPSMDSCGDCGVEDDKEASTIIHYYISSFTLAGYKVSSRDHYDV